MRYICQVCGYVYDEELEGVPFSSLPDTWECPFCLAPKSEFVPEKSGENKPEATTVTEEANLKELSAGQLSALCSNLARGLEKQYKPEEAGLFRQLADYFASLQKPIENASVELIGDLLKTDIENYSSVRQTADTYGDRGAARVTVWGEKVTRIISSLTKKYMRTGEAMLEDTDIWVCTVCGFVYVGDKAPDICPVCKVPAWKFEKIQGGTGQ